MNTETMISAQNICKGFGGVPVLRGVSLELARGEVVAVIGPSGSGKSTFLRCLNHLETIDSGRVAVEGEVLVDSGAGGRAHYVPEAQIRPIARRVGMERVKWGARGVRGVVGVWWVTRAGARAQKGGLREKREAYPKRLSGGQKQRVAIARALAMEPDILLFDEPTSALDPELTGEVLKVMRTLAAEGTTMIVVTHEMAFARDVSDRILFLHDGAIEEDGPPARVFAQPQSERCRRFLTEFVR